MPRPSFLFCARFHKNLQNKNPSAICWDFGANAHKIKIRAPVINARTGRGDRIWTCDLLVPNQTRYQTALHPENNGANEGARTLDLQFTKLLLCQLSYIGVNYRYLTAGAQINLKRAHLLSERYYINNPAVCPAKFIFHSMPKNTSGFAPRGGVLPF